MEEEAKRGNKLWSSENALALPCSKLRDHPLRLAFYSQAHLEALMSSIRTTGLLDPILVWDQGDGSYTILSGHYRVRAVRRLKQSKILCRVAACDRHTAHVIYCTSNLMTRGLSALEEAHIITGLIAQEGYTQEDAAKLWGRSKSWVCRRIKLLTELDPRIKTELEQGRLLPRVAQELSRLPQGNEQERILALVRRHHLNKDDTGALVDWWLAADTAARSEAEGAKVLPTKKNVPYKNDKEDTPEDSALTLMKRCTVLLRELILCLREHKAALNLPSKVAYRIFMTVVEDLNRFSAGVGKGGAD